MPRKVTEFGVVNTQNKYFIFASCNNLKYFRIPDEYEGFFDSSLALCNNLQVVILGKNLKYVPAQSFQQSVLLDKVILPEGLINIYTQAFYGCTSLKNVLFPESLENVYLNSFRNSGITSANFSTNLKSIGNYAFEGCSNLSEITLPNGITTIGLRTFRMSGLTSIEIPATVTSIGNNAFDSCPNLVNVKFNEGLQTIGEYAFFETDINSIILPSTVTSVGRAAFYGCENVTKLVLNEGLKTIATNAFRYLAVKSIALPYSIESIGEAAFMGCPNLEEVFLPETDHEVSFGQAVFSGEGVIGGTKISGVMYIPDSYVLVGTSNGAFWGSKITAYRVNSTNTRYMTINGVLYSRGSNNSGDDLYNTPTMLNLYPQGNKSKTYTLPATVTSIRRYELGMATNLTYINVESGNPNFVSKNGILYDKMVNSSGETVSLGVITIPQKYEINGEKITSITINDAKVFGGKYKESLDETPSAVDGWNAIGGHVENITLGTSIINIANAAFQEAYNLKTINSSTNGEFDLSNLNLGFIGFKAFEYCLNLKTLKFGKYIDSNGNEAQMTIGDGFVLHAKNLSKIYFESTIAPIINFGNYAVFFADNFANLAKDYVIYVPTGCKTTYVNAWKAQVDASLSLSDSQKKSEKAGIDEVAKHIQEYAI